MCVAISMLQLVQSRGVSFSVTLPMSRRVSIKALPIIVKVDHLFYLNIDPPYT